MITSTHGGVTLRNSSSSRSSSIKEQWGGWVCVSVKDRSRKGRKRRKASGNRKGWRGGKQRKMENRHAAEDDARECHTTTCNSRKHFANLSAD